MHRWHAERVHIPEYGSLVLTSADAACMHSDAYGFGTLGQAHTKPEKSQLRLVRESKHACCCRSLGCLDPQCVLCEHNPHRRCNVNFAPKYLVNDVLKAKCDAPIRVEIIDRQTGVPLGEDIADVHLEVRLLAALYGQPGPSLGMS